MWILIYGTKQFIEDHNIIEVKEFLSSMIYLLIIIYGIISIIAYVFYDSKLDIVFKKIT